MLLLAPLELEVLLLSHLVRDFDHTNNPVALMILLKSIDILTQLLFD
jgi:hypothetical protein